MNQMTNPERYIADLRLHEYGIGADGRQKKEFESISRKLKHSIELLSTGLYSKDIHFILELIQNAEDNKYTEPSPELEFIILDDDPTSTPGSEGCLCLFNNESGFSESNVESICGIGLSTKDKVHGYIGEKGIGFKSVFIVSSQPHIYSNGFRFCFKEKDPNIELTYIVPYWLATVPEVILNRKANTAILLPLKKGKKAGIIEELKRIEPETILFLARLEGLTVEIQSSGERIELIRDKQSKPITDLLVKKSGYKEQLSRYWVHEEDVAVPADVGEEKRKGVSERTISIAFPLDAADHKGRIFAFLPTEVDSGFPFIVNADYILSASRETIQTNRSWNEWLRDALAPVVLGGIKCMLKNEAHRTSAYRAIPLVKKLQSLHEFFAPVCNAIYADLGKSKSVLSDMGVFLTPGMSRLASKNIRSLFKNSNRPPAFKGIAFVDTGIEEFSDQLKAIGVKAFSIMDLEQCLSDVEWMKGQEGSWFVELYKYFHEAKKLEKSRIQRLPIILHDGDDVICPDSGAVYIPVGKRSVDKLKKVLGASNCPRIRFLNSAVNEALVRSPALRDWAKEYLGLLEFKAPTFIVKTLVPWADNHVDEVAVDSLIQMSQLVLDNWQHFDEEGISIIKDQLPVVLEDGRVYRKKALEGLELLTPKGLDRELGWQRFLLDEGDYAHQDVLSNEYLKLKSGVDVVDEFMAGIGAQKYPDLRGYSFAKYEGSDSPYQLYLSKFANAYPVNYTSTPRLSSWFPPVSFLDDEQRRKKKYRMAFIKWFDYMIGITDRSHSLKYASIVWFYYTNQSTSIISGLHYYLLNTEWVNTSKGYKKPGEVFIKNNQLSEMFGNQLPYLKDKMSPELCEYLGIKTDATTASIVEYLKELSTNNEVDSRLISRLYKYLDDHGKHFEKDFIDFPLIYLPKSRKGWYKSGEVVWDDLSRVFGDLYPGVSTGYDGAKFRQFFLKKLSISETVGAEELACAWMSLTASVAPEQEKITEALEKILPKILEVASSGEDKPLWWHEFIKNAKVWTQGGMFVSPDRVLAADDRQLQRFFKGRIQFVWKSERYTHQEMLALYTELGIRSLSEATEISLKSSAECQEASTPGILTKYSKRLLGYLVYSHLREFYLEQVDHGALKALLQGVECVCSTVEVLYSVKGYSVQRIDDKRKAFWDTETSTLYLLLGSDADDLLDEAAEAIAKAIWGARSREWDDTVRRVLGVSTEARYKKLHDSKGWHMPPEEYKKLRSLISSSHEKLPEVTQEASGKENVSQIPERAEPAEVIQETPAPGEERERSVAGLPSEPLMERQAEQQAQPGSELHPRPKSEPHHDGTTQRTDSRVEVDRVYLTPTEGRVVTGRPSRTGATTGQSRPRSGRSRSRSTSTRINSARQARIVSYPYPETHTEIQDNVRSKEEKRKHRELGDKAEQHIYELEIASGNIPKMMPINHPGYDIESINRDTGEVRYIEVKGQQSNWGARGVGLTHTQFKTALEKGRSYWLYVVENVESDNPNVFRINDPAHRATEYRFDSNWSQLAVSDEATEAISTVDINVLVEALTGYTEDKICKEIILHCFRSDLTLPEVGYELASDEGEVLGEIELAWPNELIAIALPGQEEAAMQFRANNWQIFYISDIEDESLRGTLFESISSIEDSV